MLGSHRIDGGCVRMGSFASMKSKKKSDEKRFILLDFRVVSVSPKSPRDVVASAIIVSLEFRLSLPRARLRSPFHGIAQSS